MSEHESTTGNSRRTPPEPAAGDRLFALARGAIASLPYVGNMAVELFTEYVAPPLQRRQAQWMNEIAESINSLERSHAGLRDSLASNEAFQDTIISATRTAATTSQEAKRTALKNAVLNAALGQAPDAALQQFFLHLVDEFTPWHLRLLAVIHNPSPGTPGTEYSSVFTPSPTAADLAPDLQPALLNCIMADVEGRGLINVSGRAVTGEASGMIPAGLTPLGEQFLAFITEPS